AILNGEYYQFAGDSSAGVEVFKYKDYEGQSYALKFRASSDNAGDDGDDSTTLPNTASLYFAAEQNAVSNGNLANTGTLVATHGITTSADSYDIAEDCPSRDDTLAPGDIVSVDPNENGFVIKTASGSASSVVGIYSGNPVFRL